MCDKNRSNRHAHCLFGIHLNNCNVRQSLLLVEFFLLIVFVWFTFDLFLNNALRQKWSKFILLQLLVHSIYTILAPTVYFFLFLCHFFRFSKQILIGQSIRFENKLKTMHWWPWQKNKRPKNCFFFANLKFVFIWQI